MSPEGRMYSVRIPVGTPPSCGLRGGSRGFARLLHGRSRAPGRGGLAAAAERLARAEALAVESRWDEACYELERAASSAPGDDALARRLRELTVRRDVESARSWAQRHAAAGRTADAIDALQRVLRLNPMDAAARARLAALGYGEPGAS